MKKMIAIIIIATGLILIAATAVVVIVAVTQNSKGGKQEPDPIVTKKPADNGTSSERILQEYRYSSGGGMDGSSYSFSIKRYDEEKAKVTITETGGFAANGKQPTTETVKYVDVKILDDLQDVIEKNKMDEWNQMKFTDEFVYDGESYSYSFNYGNADYVSFSSQIYPEKYRKKLNKLDEVIDSYLKDGETK